MTIQEAARQLNNEFSKIDTKDKTFEEKIDEIEKILTNILDRLSYLENGSISNKLIEN